MTTTNNNNSVPQWAIDAASQHYASYIEGGFADANRLIYELATIIARYAPTCNERLAANIDPDNVIASQRAEIARLREALNHVVIDINDTLRVLPIAANDSRVWALRETMQSACDILNGK